MLTTSSRCGPRTPRGSRSPRLAPVPTTCTSTEPRGESRGGPLMQSGREHLLWAGRAWNNTIGYGEAEVGATGLDRWLRRREAGLTRIPFSFTKGQEFNGKFSPAASGSLI